MRARRITLFLLLSLLLHVPYLWTVFQLMQHREIPKPEKTERITIRLIEEPPPPEPEPQPSPPKKKEKVFVDSSEMIRTDKPDPEAAFESDANTQASSITEGEGPESLPNQMGRREHDLVFRDSQYSPNSPTQPSPPTPVEKEPQPPAQPPVETVAKKPQEKRSMEDILMREGDLFSIKDNPEPETVKPAAPPNPPKPQVQPNNAPRSPPQSVFSADRRRTEISGGAAVGHDSSAASQETEMGRYKAKLYRAIGSRWYHYVQSQLSLLSVGKIRLRFYVRSNGVIEEPQVVHGDSKTVLAALSRRSVIDVGSMEPFSPQLKQQLGDGYWEEITFSIY